MSEKFKEIIRQKRANDFPNTFELVHDTFLRLGLDKKSPDYFFDNASKIVEDLREENWNTFLKHERLFSEKICQGLIKENIDDLKPREAVEGYIHDNVDNFYILSL